MQRTAIAAGWYGEALPDGAYAVLLPGAFVRTPLGDIALPANEDFGPLYLRLTTIDSFRFAGQAHSAGVTWEYVAGSGWLQHPIGIGVSPVIYDNFGTLVISPGGPPVGSQGYRFVDAANKIWTGDETYYADGISEWTDLGDGIRIGQGHAQGDCVVRFPGEALRVLEPGNCTFVRANRAGDDVAVAMVKPGACVLFWLTLAELHALPFQVPVEPPEPPTKPPPTKPPEPPEPPKPPAVTLFRVATRYP